MAIANINTWIMGIDPAGFRKYEWDVNETIQANSESEYEAGSLSDRVDYNNTDYDGAYRAAGKRVFDWMQSIKLFRGLDRSLPGFKIKFKDVTQHGYVGKLIEMQVKIDAKADLIHAIRRLPKGKFDDYMFANHSSGSGFHSSIPNSRDGLLEQNDTDYMMACYIGYRIQSRTTATFGNDYTSEPAKFNERHACSELMDFESSCEAYDFIRFTPKKI